MLYRICMSQSKAESLFDLLPVGDKPKTCLQFMPKQSATIVGWGLTFAGSAPCVKVDLIESDVPATIVPLAEEDVQSVDEHAAAHRNVGALFDLSEEGTGVAAVNEGGSACVRTLDTALIPPHQTFVRQFQPKQGIHITPNTPVRIRCEAPSGQTAQVAAFLLVEF